MMFSVVEKYLRSITSSKEKMNCDFFFFNLPEEYFSTFYYLFLLLKPLNMTHSLNLICRY